MPPQVTFTTKLKVALKTAIARLRIVQAKDSAVAKQARRQMATLLESGRVESARIRVENIIRADLTTELHELLELYCELLLARIALLERPADEGVDPGLDEAVRGILFAAPRCEIKELSLARALLESKYGGGGKGGKGDEKGGIVKEAMAGEGVSERVKRKLDSAPPRQELVEEYLRAIAAAYDVPYGDDTAEVDAQLEEMDFDDEDEGNDADDDERGGKEEPLTTGELGSMTPPRLPLDLNGRSPLSVAPPSPSTERPLPVVKGAEGLTPTHKVKAMSKSKSKPLAGTGASNGTSNSSGNGSAKSAVADDGKKKPEGEIPNVDDLAARFAMLKK